MQDQRLNESLPLSDDEREFERAMSRLAPQPPGIDARQIWMKALAGKQRRQVVFWRIVSGGLAACLAAAVWPGGARESFRPRAGRVSQQVSETRESVPSEPGAVVIPFEGAVDWRANGTDDSYLNLRQRVMLRGLSALDTGPRYSAAAPVPAYRQPVEPHVDSVVAPAADGPINRFFNLFERGTNL